MVAGLARLNSGSRDKVTVSILFMAERQKYVYFIIIQHFS